MEKRQIELAKKILESKGYKVTEPLNIDIAKVENIISKYSILMEKLR